MTGFSCALSESTRPTVMPRAQENPPQCREQFHETAIHPKVVLSIAALGLNFRDRVHNVGNWLRRVGWY